MQQLVSALRWGKKDSREGGVRGLELYALALNHELRLSRNKHQYFKAIVVNVGQGRHLKMQSPLSVAKFVRRMASAIWRKQWQVPPPQPAAAAPGAAASPACMVVATSELGIFRTACPSMAAAPV